jgi:hypothetical protein
MVPLRIFRALLPPAERAEVIADLETEYGVRRARDGRLASSRWLWGQLFASGPTLLRRSWWRGRTGFESTGNAMNPGGPLMERWIVEARFAVRRLRTRPTYTASPSHARPRRWRNGGDRRHRATLLVNPLPYPATTARNVWRTTVVQSRIRHAASAVDGILQSPRSGQRT